MSKLNVLELLKKKGKSKYWLYNEMNNVGTISYSNFNSLIEQKTKSIKYENIDKLCKILECDVSDLISKE